MNFIKYFCCCFNNKNDEIKYERRCDEIKLHELNQHELSQHQINCHQIKHHELNQHEPKLHELKLHEPNNHQIKHHHQINHHHKTNQPHKSNIIKSNTIHFHELRYKTVEDIKQFTVVTDTNGNTVVKPYSFVYLGYPFVESDTD